MSFSAVIFLSKYHHHIQEVNLANNLIDIIPNSWIAIWGEFNEVYICIYVYMYVSSFTYVYSCWDVCILVKICII
jgi:hypothetical protein